MILLFPNGLRVDTGRIGDKAPGPARMDQKLELLELAVIWDQGQARDNE